MFTNKEIEQLNKLIGRPKIEIDNLTNEFPTVAEYNKLMRKLKGRNIISTELNICVNQDELKKLLSTFLG